MTRTESRPAATLPPVTLTPEEAAAIAVALAAQPDGPYAADGRAALEKVLDVLEPDAARRAQLLATSLWVSAEAGHSRGDPVGRRAGGDPPPRAGRSATATAGAPPHAGRSSRSCWPRAAGTGSSWRGAASGTRCGGSGRTASRASSSPPRRRRGAISPTSAPRRPTGTPPGGHWTAHWTRPPRPRQPAGWSCCPGAHIGRRLSIMPRRRPVTVVGVTTAPARDPAHPVRARRRLRLQDPARRAGGRRRRADAPPVRPRRTPNWSSASTTATTPPSCGSPAARGWC